MALLLVALSLGLAGCELVFGLDDYAQASSEGTTGSTGTAAGPGAGAGSSGSRSSDSTGSGSDGGGGGGDDTSSTSTGEPTCPCVPEGWTLKKAYPTTTDDPLVTCDLGINADRALADPAVSCTCSCAMDPTLDCQLACWAAPGCVGNATVLPDSLCGGLFPAASCTQQVVRNGVPAASDLCIADGDVIGTTNTNVFDLCAASAAGVSCGDEGVCDEPPDGAAWCIEGPADEACPVDWPDDHTVSEGGTPACDCSCNDDIICDGTFRLASNSCITDGVDIVSRNCQDVPDRDNYTAGPQLGEDDSIGGGCSPTQTEGPGHVEGATETRLCCLVP